MMTLLQCPDCKRSVSGQATSCPNCGYPLRRVSRKSRSLAVLLAALFGGLGAHRFYLDQPGTGLLYLLFVWTLIPAVLGIVEAVFYLLLGEKHFHERYG